MAKEEGRYLRVPKWLMGMLVTVILALFTFIFTWGAFRGDISAEVKTNKQDINVLKKDVKDLKGVYSDINVIKNDISWIKRTLNDGKKSTKNN